MEESHCPVHLSKRQQLRILGAIEGTRTPTPLRVHGPEPCASANSATMASRQSTAAVGTPPHQEDLRLYFTVMISTVKRDRL
jgi:hypothetical protein